MSSFNRGTEVEQVIAAKDMEVQDPATDDKQFKRQIVAGQPVPPELLEAYADASGDKRAKAQTAPAMDKALKAPATSK